VICRHVALLPGVPNKVAAIASLFDGVLGVRFFFTISGFLITWQLLNDERNNGCASLKRFYIRRAVRILPVYVTFLLVMAMLQVAGFYYQSCFIWLQNLTFTRNFFQTGNFEYLATAHLWSLSVEEQFYFLWPLGFLLLPGQPAKRIRLLIGVIILSAIWKTIALFGSYNRQLFFLFEPFSTLLHMDCLAYGCIGAILFATGKEGIGRFFKKYSLPILLLSSAAILVPEIAGLEIGLQPLGFSLLLLESVFLPEFGPFQFLNHPWVIKCGIVSYSLYIWHELILCLWPLPALWFLALPATFAVGWASYLFLEKPFFGLRQKLRVS